MQPTTSEQREGIYDDLREMLVPGFLSHSIKILGNNISLRSLFHNEFLLLKTRVGTDATSHEWKCWAVAMSMWSVNGFIYLSNQDSTILTYRFVRDLPNSVLDILFYIFQGLLNRSRNSTDLIEAFSYEDYSRFFWKQNLGDFQSATGIPGISDLGKNAIQLTWTALNRFEDEKEQIQVDWNCAKLAAKVHAPKDIDKMDERERMRHNDDLFFRQETQDVAYYRFHNYNVISEYLEERREKSEGRNIKSVHTLEGEYKNWVDGELDHHDQVFNSCMQKIDKRIEAEIDNVKERRKALGVADGFFDPDEGNLQPGFVGYTPAQVQELVARDAGPYGIGSKTLPDDSFVNRYDVYQRRRLNSRHTRQPPQSPKLTLNEKVAQRSQQLRER